MNIKKKLSLLLFTGMLIFAVNASDKKVVLDEYNLIQESETPESVRAINLSDGKWIMVYYTEQEAMYSWDELVIFSPNKNYSVWNFTVDGNSVIVTAGHDLWQGTLQGDIAKFKKNNAWVKKCIKGNEFNNPSGDYQPDKLQKSSTILKQLLLPKFAKELPEDSTHVIKTNSDRTKFIYDSKNAWQENDGRIFEGNVIIYFAKAE